MGPSTLTFSEAGTQLYPVAIVDDREVDTGKEFTLILSNPRPDAVVFNPGSFIISVVNNDGEIKTLVQQCFGSHSFSPFHTLGHYITHPYQLQF